MSWRGELMEECEHEYRPALFRFFSLQWFELPKWRRASHLCVCGACGKLYIEHPMHSDGVLNRLCNGDLVKL